MATVGNIPVKVIPIAPPWPTGSDTLSVSSTVQYRMRFKPGFGRGAV